MNRVEGCGDCSRLWDAYAAATHRLFRAQGKVQVAVFAHDRQHEEELLALVREAEDERNASHSAMLRHQMEAHAQPAPRSGTGIVTGSEQEAALRDALERARAEYLKVLADQASLLSDVPSGIPSPDGKFPLEHAARLRSLKYQSYSNAASALSRFLAESAPRGSQDQETERTDY